MKKEFVRYCIVVSVLLLAVAAVAGAAGKAEGSGEKKTIRFSSPMTAADPLSEFVDTLIDEYNAREENFRVVHDALPSAEYRTNITVEMAAGNPAHCGWTILSYSREFTKQGTIIDWRPVYDDPRHPEFKKWFSDTVLEAPTYKGKIMHAPWEVHADGLFYNQELFDELGLEVPETFDEFLALGPVAREHGLALTVTGGADIRFAWLASALLVHTGGIENANALALGDAMTEWDNPDYGFPQAMQKFKEMVDAGVYPTGVLGIGQNEADQVFVRGEALTYYEGSWRPGNFRKIGGEEFMSKLRRAPFPAMTDMPMGNQDYVVGGLLNGMFVASKYPEDEQQAAIRWIKEVNSPRFFRASMEAENKLYAGAERMEWDNSGASQVWLQVIDAFNNAPGFIPSMDTFAPPPVDLAIKQTAMPGLITGELTVEQAVAAVQDAADDYLSSQ